MPWPPNTSCHQLGREREGKKRNKKERERELVYAQAFGKSSEGVRAVVWSGGSRVTGG